MKPISRWCTTALTGLALTTINFQQSTVFAQGTAFGYQGQLNVNGSPVTGIYSLTFTLFETNSGGTAIVGPVTNNAVSVNNGLFSATIDFGVGVWNGQTNWVEIGVATNGSASFTTLAPRQEITPVPYTIYAESAASAGILGSGVALGQGQGDSIASGDMNSFIGGGFDNTMQSSVNYSVIDGGDGNTIQNGSSESFIGGGTANSIQGNNEASSIVAGFSNIIHAGNSYSIIGGGSNNVILSGNLSVIVGGEGNSVGFGLVTGPAYESFIGGGANNVITSYGYGQTICGGISNFIALADGNGLCTIGGGMDNAIAVDDYAGDYCTIGGGFGNFIWGGQLIGSVIAGGVSNTFSYATVCSIGGGFRNFIDTESYGTIGGGYSNRIGNDFNDGGYVSPFSTIAGGNANYVQQQDGVIGGGLNNVVTGSRVDGLETGGTVGGGISNVVNGTSGTIPGGQYNVATTEAFAAGNQALATNQGAFVWADSQNAGFGSVTSNSVSFRCLGGVQFTSGFGAADQTVSWVPGAAGWSFSSDRNLKDRFEAVDSESVLDKVTQLPITEWSYKGYGERHIGAMAQDFHALFPLNDNDKALNEADLHGVELAAIQGLDQKLQEQAGQLKNREIEIQNLKQQNNLLEERLNKLEQAIKSLAGKN